MDARGTAVGLVEYKEMEGVASVALAATVTTVEAEDCRAVSGGLSDGR